MQFNTSLPAALRPYYEQELSSFRQNLDQGRLNSAWKHLERAHIIGQRYPFAHSFVHWKMLQFGIKIKNRKEVLGQIPRLLVGGIKSFVGKVPVGNPGGANVPPLKPFPIEEELLEIFEQVGVAV